MTVRWDFILKRFKTIEKQWLKLNITMFFNLLTLVLITNTPLGVNYTCVGLPRGPQIALLTILPQKSTPPLAPSPRDKHCSSVNGADLITRPKTLSLFTLNGFNAPTRLMHGHTLSHPFGDDAGHGYSQSVYGYFVNIITSYQ